VPAVSERTERQEIHVAAYTARYMGQHLMRTGGTVPVDRSLVFAIALLLCDVPLIHSPAWIDGEWMCERDSDEWPCSDVKRALEVAELINIAWPQPPVEGGVRP
jgi:hypothetical protein